MKRGGRESQCGRMRAQERLDWRWVLAVWLGRDDRVEERGEVLASADGEPIARIVDDVREGAVRILETNGEARIPALGSLSAMVGTPLALEKRAMTGVEAAVRNGARLSDVAPGEGVNVPVRTMPLACAIR